MFFILGMTNGRQDFDYRDTIICPSCGRLGGCRVFMTYMQVLLFFIPCFRWNKAYYVEMSCCKRVFKLNPRIGIIIQHGGKERIRQEDLMPL